MKHLFILIATFLSLNAFAIDNKLPNNTTIVGQKTSSGTKQIIFENNLGASNTMITSTPSLNDLKLKTSKVKVGTGVVSSSPEVQFNIGTVSSPTIRYNDSTSKIEFSNDGVAYKGIGSGSGGGGGGINLLENPDFEASVTQGWLASGLVADTGSYTVPTTDNAKFVSLTATVSGSYYESSSYQISDVLNGQDCELNANYQNLTGSWRAEVFASGTVIASQTLSNNTNWAAAPKIFYPCGQLATSLTKVRFTNLVSGTLALDDVYLGSIRSLKNGAIVEPEYPCALTSPSFGATNMSVQCWRVGDKLKARGHFRVGTPQATPAKISLPIGLEIDIPKTGVNQSQIFGTWVRGIDATQVALAANTVGPRVMVINTPDPLNVHFASLSNANGGGTPSANFTVQNGSALTATNDQISFDFEVPIKGWSGSGVTYDSVCSNDIACQDTFSFKVSAAGVVSEEYLDIINGNCGVVTNAFTCTWQPNVFPQGVSCTGTENGGGGNQSVSTNGGTSSTLTYTTTLNAAATALQTTWVCHRTNSVVRKTVEGYLSKTVNHSGLIPIKISTGFFGQATSTTICTASPCGIFSSSGDVASIPRVTTGSIQLVFNASTWTSPPTCYFNVRTTAANTNIYPSLVSTSTTVYEVRFADANNSGTDSYGHFLCVGF